jgi:phosphoglycolate phosphatase
MTGADAPGGVIFDLDGTLWDSTETVAAAWTRVLGRMGGPARVITPAEIAAVMGKPHRELYQALFPGLPQARQEALALACYAEEERDVHARGGRLYPGVREVLAALAARRPLFIVSNCQQGYIEAFLAWSGLAERFRDFECHGNTGADKAENLRRIVRRNGLRRPWYVGDTEGDRAAAAAAGLPFVHAAYGFGRIDAAERSVAAFGELLPLLEGAEAPRPA